MKTNSTYERLMRDPKRRAAIEEEGFLLELAEDIYIRMEKRGMTKADLARKLGVSRARITQFFNGTGNMTLRTLYKLSHALNYEIAFSFESNLPISIAEARFEKCYNSNLFSNLKPISSQEIVMGKLAA